MQKNLHIGKKNLAKAIEIFRKMYYNISGAKRCEVVHFPKNSLKVG